MLETRMTLITWSKSANVLAAFTVCRTQSRHWKGLKDEFKMQQQMMQMTSSTVRENEGSSAFEVQAVAAKKECWNATENIRDCKFRLLHRERNSRSRKHFGEVTRSRLTACAAKKQQGFCWSTSSEPQFMELGILGSSMQTHLSMRSF